MQGSNSFVKINRPQRVRPESFETKQERKASERNRQAARAGERGRKYSGD